MLQLSIVASCRPCINTSQVYSWHWCLFWAMELANVLQVKALVPWSILVRETELDSSRKHSGHSTPLSLGQAGQWVVSRVPLGLGVITLFVAAICTGTKEGECDEGRGTGLLLRWLQTIRISPLIWFCHGTVSSGAICHLMLQSLS